MGQSWGASLTDPGPGAQGGVHPTPGGRWEEAELLTPSLLPPGPSREPGLQAAQTENVRSSTESGVETGPEWEADLPRTTWPVAGIVLPPSFYRGGN